VPAALQTPWPLGFRQVEERFAELRRRLGEITDLRTTFELLFWDQTVMMPPAGGAVRAEQLTTLERLSHDLFVSDEIGALLEELRPYEESLPDDSDEASIIRVTRRDWEKARRVPTELAAAMAKLASEAQDVWAKARQDSDYASFRPWLDRTLELKQRYIACFEPYDDRYDPLLDDYEPGMRTPEVREVFETLKEALVPLIAEVGSPEQDDFMHGPFPEEQQRSFSLRIIERFGYTPVHFRLDETVHPFAATSGTQDIRLTTRYSESDLTSLFTAMHECGHGLYEHGVSETLERTPLAHGVSSALHESQSRLWENVVGRSRPFWEFFYPQLQETFTEALGGVELERFVRSVNRARPSFVRVDADEATYSLHIILRFELEQELLSGSLSTADLPEAWNARFKEYLGLDVPEDRLGVLQDVHWSGGSFGYFPTYALGNVVGLQIWERVRADLPDLDEQFARGEFGPLHEWLRERVYRHGRKFTPQELLERVVGGGMDAGPYVRYLREKFGALAAA
jgi:carboxypeptidase Taq